MAESVSAHLKIRYGIEMEVDVSSPKESHFGDLGTAAVFSLAKQLRKAPRVIGAEILAEMPPIEGISGAELAGHGFINFRFDRASYGAGLVAKAAGTAAPETSGKIIVEHTNINPNKAAHIGHLRNAVLGDTFVRMLRARGRRVEVQNYIDNTGVQVADVVAGFLRLEGKTPEEVARLAADGERFDYLCWDLYARTSAHYQENPDALAWRRETLHEIEAGEGAAAEMAHIVSDAIVQCHLNTMWRLGVVYDVLPRESEILHLKFWATAFELLKERKAIYLETEGKNAGCWVMPGAAYSTDSETEDSKVIVRSNGTVTYVGKDIAYQLWKFGLLGKDFYYRPLMTYPNGHELWITTDEPQPAGASFGRGARVYNVIDSRQSYLQDVVVAGLKALGFEEQADRSIHFSYEMVALSPRCCAELGIALSEEDRKRPYVEVSGRKGLGVKADDLIDKLIEEALDEVASRHPEAAPEKQRTMATQIAIGALRYFMLKFTKTSVIAFDFKEALSFEGETGPYAQYAIVRATNIFRKAGLSAEEILCGKTDLRFLKEDDELWELWLRAGQLSSMVEQCISTTEPAYAAKYAFQLAQQFNNFYHKHHILTETDEAKKRFLLATAAIVRRALIQSLELMGIGAPSVM